MAARWGAFQKRAKDILRRLAARERRGASPAGERWLLLEKAAEICRGEELLFGCFGKRLRERLRDEGWEKKRRTRGKREESERFQEFRLLRRKGLEEIS